MRWIGSSWDRTPRVYKEGITRMNSTSKVFDDWGDCLAHIVGLHEAEVRRVEGLLTQARTKLEVTKMATRPDGV